MGTAAKGIVVVVDGVAAIVHCEVDRSSPYLGDDPLAKRGYEIAVEAADPFSDRWYLNEEELRAFEAYMEASDQVSSGDRQDESVYNFIPGEDFDYI